MARALEALLGAIARADPSPRLLFVGDYVNRGPDSRAVIDLLLGLSNAQCIRGNHDDIFDEVLNGQSYAMSASRGDRLVAFSWFMQHGLDQTLASYGIDWAQMRRSARQPTAGRLDELLEAVPESHRRFIRELPAVIEEPDLFVAHGAWNVDDADGDPRMTDQLAADARRRQALLWGRFQLKEIIRPKAWRRTGYFGHTTVDNYPELLGNGPLRPIVAPSLVLLDTAAALRPDGLLSAYCHESRQCLRAERHGRIIGIDPVPQTE